MAESTTWGRRSLREIAQESTLQGVGLHSAVTTASSLTSDSFGPEL